MPQTEAQCSTCSLATRAGHVERSAIVRQPERPTHRFACSTARPLRSLALRCDVCRRHRVEQRVRAVVLPRPFHAGERVAAAPRSRAAPARGNLARRSGVAGGRRVCPGPAHGPRGFGCFASCRCAALLGHRACCASRALQMRATSREESCARGLGCGTRTTITKSIKLPLVRAACTAFAARAVRFLLLTRGHSRKWCAGGGC